MNMEEQNNIGKRRKRERKRNKKDWWSHVCSKDNCLEICSVKNEGLGFEDRVRIRLWVRVCERCTCRIGSRVVLRGMWSVWEIDAEQLSFWGCELWWIQVIFIYIKLSKFKHLYLSLKEGIFLVRISKHDLLEHGHAKNIYIYQGLILSKVSD